MGWLLFHRKKALGFPLAAHPQKRLVYIVHSRINCEQEKGQKAVFMRTFKQDPFLVFLIFTCFPSGISRHLTLSAIENLCGTHED